MAHPDRQTFASFVTGRANRAARTWALTILQPVPAGEPSRLYLLHGGAARGKTHLARAIVAEATRRRQWARYLAAPELVPWPPFFGGLQARTLIRRLVRTEIVVFDDVAHLPPDGRGRGGFLELVASLAGAGRRIVLVTGAVPADLAALVPPDARMELLEPERRLREDILTAMAADAGLLLDANGASLLAGHLPTDLDALERAVGRLAPRIPRGAPGASVPLEVLWNLLQPAAPEPGLPARPRRTRAPGPEEDATIEAGYRELQELVVDIGRNVGTPTRLGRDVLVPLIARDGERYVLRMRPTRYLERPLHCTFVDEEGRAEVSTAWPRSGLGNPFRSPNFICTSPTAEYHAVHREHPYRAGEGSFANTAATIFAALHAPEYAGRSRR